MSFVAGIQSGLVAGLRSGLNPSDAGGGGPTMDGVEQDSTSGIYMPFDASEWDQTLSVAGISSGGPSSLWSMGGGEGDVSDSIGSITLTALGGLTYETETTGWTNLGIKTTSGAQGNLISTDAGLPDISTTSCLLLFYAATPAAVATLRTLAQLGPNFDGGLEARLNASEQIAAIRAGVETTGAATFCDGAVHPVVMQVNRTGNVAGIYTDQEKLTGAAAGSGKCVMIGGDNNRSYDSDAITYLYATMFTGAAAELSAAQIKTLLTTLGWSVAWSP